MSDSNTRRIVTRAYVAWSIVRCTFKLLYDKTALFIRCVRRVLYVRDYGALQLNANVMPFE